MVGWAGRWPVESVRVEAPGEEEEARRDAPEKVPGLATGLAEQSSGKRGISSSSLLREDKVEGQRTWRRHRMAGAAAWPRVASAVTRRWRVRLSGG